MHNLRIGFFTKWPINSLESPLSIVYGDELYFRSISQFMKKDGLFESVKLYSPIRPPDKKIDCMIYINDTKPVLKYAKKHILYLQNPYRPDSYKVLLKLRKYNFDGYLFISKNLLQKHLRDGFKGRYLPFGVNTDIFYPHKFNKRYNFEISFVGNDYKEKRLTKKYLLPLLNYNFGLFGKWGEPNTNFLGIKNKLLIDIKFSHRVNKVRLKQPKTINMLYYICRGKISQDEVATLYSSSKINLNYSAQDNINYHVTTLRLLEIMACKGFALSDTISPDKKFNSSFVYTSGGIDLIDKINYYLSHPQEKETYISKGFDYVQKYARIEYRVKDLINYLNTIL
ncbi:hypothetical protein A2768_00035 [Candidatus Roizmanbacteria bacterium RIFCSPHIGHO2_01_FULL_37_16]|nr:MAG: hypothetical protein A2768_00035 [Candidatus Roizmanbacteria bacterium RIFCSPHIGHO2_01_FULL_37_16]